MSLLGNSECLASCSDDVVLAAFQYVVTGDAENAVATNQALVAVQQPQPHPDIFPRTYPPGQVPLDNSALYTV